MKFRWLAILACVLMVACNESTPPDDAGDGGSAAQEMKAPDADAEAKTDADGDAKADADGDADAKADDNAFDPNASNDDPKTDVAEKGPSIGQQVADIRTAMDDAMTAVRQAAPADRGTAITEFRKTVSELSEQLFELGQEDPASEGGMEALSLFIERGSDANAKAEAIKLLMEHHMDSPKMGTMAMQLARGNPSEETENQLKTLLEKSPADEVKASALYSMTQFYKNVSRMQDYAKSNPAYNAPEFVTNFDAESVDLEAMLERIADEYADIEVPGRGSTFGELVEPELFEIRYLTIGKEAPDIVGKDFDEVEFKLSDYRGKVVVLDFWGDW